MKRFLAVMMAILLVVGCTFVAAAEDSTQTESYSDLAEDAAHFRNDSLEMYQQRQSYNDYREEKLKSYQSGTQAVVIDADQLTTQPDGESVIVYSGNEMRTTYQNTDADINDGKNFDSAVYTSEDSSVEFTFTLEQAGLYNLYVEYFTLEEGTGSAIERELMINGEIPFDVAEDFNFNRVWTDVFQTDENGNKVFQKDIYGNEIRPDQEQVYCWTSSYFYDYLGHHTEKLLFAFEQGENTLTLNGVKEPMLIGRIELIPAVETISYADYIKNYSESDYYDGEELIIEGEFPVQKSDQTMIPVSDVSSVSTSASGADVSAYVMLMNEIGGTSWQYPQQSISWTVGEDAKPGLYAVNFKVRKNVNEGMISSRTFYVNGEVPFEEAMAMRFTYSKDWKNVAITDDDGNPCYVYLEPGDTITLEATLGDMGDILRRAEIALTEINAIYRQILIITGSSPDKYRDYQLDELIPETIDEMKVQSDELTSIVNAIVEFTGTKGSDMSSLDTLARQLNDMHEDPDIIAKQLSFFKTNIGSYGTWLNSANSAPLELDYISLSAPGSEIQKATKGFFANLGYSFNRFIASFVVDYNAIGNMTETTDDENTITVWISSGRDQNQILRSMINNSYTASTGNQVNLELVNAGALLSAVVAGIGPDVVLGQAKNEPVNFALRGAAYDLTQFDDLDEITKRFAEEAMVPYRLVGPDGHEGVYALPETQDFMVLYYRSDVLAELGLSVPDTWEDVITCVTVLNKNNMEFGLPAQEMTTQCFYTFLLQHDGRLYNDDATGTDLNTDAATKAFKMLTNFYVNYDFPMQYDFQNRFRTGELPMGIASFTQYNTLAVAAPEIRGLWGFTVLPGMEQADGTINRKGDLSTTACFILSDNVNVEKSWEFLKWWTSTEVQTEYGNQLESVMGTAARYNTANIESFNALPWSADELESLNMQLSVSQQIPEIPGSYFLTRHINNAWRNVVYSNLDPKDTLYDYSKTIDNEITSKREEFGYSNPSEK